MESKSGLVPDKFVVGQTCKIYVQNKISKVTILNVKSYRAAPSHHDIMSAKAQGENTRTGNTETFSIFVQDGFKISYSIFWLYQFFKTLQKNVQ